MVKVNPNILITNVDQLKSAINDSDFIKNMK